MASTSYTVTRGDDEIEIDVDYEVSRYYPARTYGPPEDCYPAEGGEVTDLSATLDGQPFELTEAERERIEQHIYETHDYDDDGRDYED